MQNFRLCCCCCILWLGRKVSCLLQHAENGGPPSLSCCTKVFFSGISLALLCSNVMTSCPLLCGMHLTWGTAHSVSKLCCLNSTDFGLKKPDLLRIFELFFRTYPLPGSCLCFGFSSDETVDLTVWLIFKQCALLVKLNLQAFAHKFACWVRSMFKSKTFVILRCRRIFSFLMMYPKHGLWKTSALLYLKSWFTIMPNS